MKLIAVSRDVKTEEIIFPFWLNYNDFAFLDEGRGNKANLLHEVWPVFRVYRPGDFGDVESVFRTPLLGESEDFIAYFFSKNHF